MSDDCPECPDNPLLIWNNQDVLDVLVTIQSALAAVVLGALIWRLVRRRHESDDPNDRVREAPVWWAGGATLLLIIAVLATNVAPEEGNFDDYLFAAALAVLATVPYAFLVGVLRSKLWEADVVADENVRLDAELQARLDELRESRARIVEAGYAERRRVERDLHDGAQQRLVAARAPAAAGGLEAAERSRRERLGSSTRPRTSWPRRPRSCVSWPAASTRRCSPTVGWWRAGGAGASERRCPSRSRPGRPSERRRRWRPPPTSSCRRR